MGRKSQALQKKGQNLKNAIKFIDGNFKILAAKLCNEMKAINSLGDFPSIPFMASFHMNDFLGLGLDK